LSRIKLKVRNFIVPHENPDARVVKAMERAVLSQRSHLHQDFDRIFSSY